MNKLLFATALGLMTCLGAGCALTAPDPPIATYDDCVARGYPANEALSQCRAKGKIFYKYGQSTTPNSTASTSSRW